MGDVLNSRAMVLVAGVLGAESLKHPWFWMVLASLICLHLSEIVYICLSSHVYYIRHVMIHITSELGDLEILGT